MTSITAQQTKLDLELVPKENRLHIGKFNGRIPQGFSPMEPTFQVVLDALALTPCYPAFLITTDVLEVYMHQLWNCIYKHDDFYRFKIDKKKRFKLTLEVFRDILQIFPRMHQPWRTFAALINRSLSRKMSGLDKLRLSRAQIIWGEVPPKVARKFKKASPSKKESELVPRDEEPVKKGKRLKTPAKKSASKTATCIVIREPHVETKSKRKEKEKVDVAHGKGIDLLSEVALSKKAQMKEARKKSLRDFHKTHPSGSGTVVEKPPSVEKITPTITSEGTGDKPGVPDVTNDDSSERESKSWGNDEDDSNNKQESSDESSKQENESKEQELDSEQDKESDDDDQEEEEIDQQNESEDDEMKSEGNDTEMTESQQGNKNLETTHEQVVEDAHVTISTVPKKTKVLVTKIVSPLDVHLYHEVPRTQAPTLLTIPVSVIPESSSIFANIPQSLYTFNPTPIQATPTPPPTIETTNPLSNHPNFSSVFRFNDRITALAKEVDDLKKDPLHTQVASLVDSHLDTRMEVSNFAPPVIEKLIKESRDEVTLAKRGRKDKDKDEDPSAVSDRGLNNRKLSKDAEPTTEPKKKDSTSGSSKGTKSQPKSFGNLGDNKDEPRGETASRRDWFKKPTPPQEPTDHDWNVGKTTKEGPTQNWLMTLAASTSTDKSLKDFGELMSPPIDFSRYILNRLKIENLTQEIFLGPAFRLLKGTRSNYAELEYDFEECYKALSKKLDWENPESDEYLFDLSKPLPLITRGKHQRVPFEFFINNDLKYFQGGISTMTYTTSTTKTKAVKYDLLGIEDMVLNIWSHVKVSYDKYALWGISHWREQRKSFYAFARGMQSRGDVYLTKRILAVTHVSEGDFPRLWINDIEDILLLMVQNRLTNLSGYDVADFAIALRMFTRSLVIQKRVKDLQLGVKICQKKINVTKPDTTRPDLRKRHPYTPYKDPQGFIYVERPPMKNRIWRRKSSFHDQGHQQAAKGKEDDEEFGEICIRSSKSSIDRK
ncbi:hypothetical protein Tco_1229408 [Tanacetum coccineum]